LEEERGGEGGLGGEEVDYTRTEGEMGVGGEEGRGRQGHHHLVSFFLFLLSLAVVVVLA